MSCDSEAELQAAADAAICSLFLMNDSEEDILASSVFEERDLTRRRGSVTESRSTQRNEPYEHHRLTHQSSNSSLGIHGLDPELRDEDVHQPSSAAARSDSVNENHNDMAEAGNTGKAAKGHIEQSPVLDLAAVMDRCGGDLELLHSVMDR